MADESGGADQPIVVKKIVKGGGHHGGAWKVAYADFVTAMMAFFLLLWLLNVSTDEQKNAISNYFDPAADRVSQSMSGAGGVLGGTSVSQQGAMTTDIQKLSDPSPTGKAGQEKAEKIPVHKIEQETGTTQGVQMVDSSSEQARAELKKEEEDKLNEVKEAIEIAVQENPEMAELMENLMIDMTPEGLRIQVVDSEGRPMFPSGSARMFDRTKQLLNQVGQVIQSVENEISIKGHTDSIPYSAGADYTNWELSADRANSSRRELQSAGVSSDRLNNVVGKADTEHLLPDDPTNARNRRISIVLLREEIANPEAYQEKLKERTEQKRKAMAPLPNPDGTASEIFERNLQDPQIEIDVVPTIEPPEPGRFRKSDGIIEFP